MEVTFNWFVPQNYAGSSDGISAGCKRHPQPALTQDVLPVFSVSNWNRNGRLYGAVLDSCGFETCRHVPGGGLPSIGRSKIRLQGGARASITASLGIIRSKITLSRDGESTDILHYSLSEVRGTR
ncbi:hypothetical protein [Rhizobium gallicum]|uniref:hypothetical protein n=1 Tax=Rhizobium gallicum TaxID=56730 RepID=UPI001EF7BF23|nr:hypothetical protein [Rhizobium gallicum]ULJ71415.1 hypothetical protein L2W42_16355 [Rhizobium gallicum]